MRSLNKPFEEIEWRDNYTFPVIHLYSEDGRDHMMVVTYVNGCSNVSHRVRVDITDSDIINDIFALHHSVTQYSYYKRANLNVPKTITKFSVGRTGDHTYSVIIHMDKDIYDDWNLKSTIRDDRKETKSLKELMVHGMLREIVDKVKLENTIKTDN